MGLVKSGIIFLLVTLCSLSAAAQEGTLAGRVAQVDGTPAAYVTVLLQKQNRHCLTSDQGEFTFTALPYGHYEIRVTSMEVKDTTFQIEHNRNSEPQVLAVMPNIITLDGVTVTGNSAKREMEIAGFAVNVVETQRFALQSLQTNDLLDRAAGVRVRQEGGLGSRTGYNVNGLSGEAIKIFIDGVPARNYGPSFSLSSIPPALIERIEVFKGVVPGYLAEDALGGAINVILKKQRANSLTTSYSVGSFNTHQWDAAGSYRMKNGLTFDASAFYNYSDNNYKVWGDDIFFVDYQGKITESDGKKVERFNDAYRSAGGKFGIGFTDVKWADQFMIGGVFSDDKKQIQHGTTMRVVYGDRHYKRKANVLTMSYAKRDFLTEGLSVNVEASYSDLTRENIDTVGIVYDWAGPIRYPDGSYVRYNSGAEANSTSKTAAVNREHTYAVRANVGYRIHKNHTVYANYLLNDFERKVSDPYQVQALQMLRNTRDLQKHVMAFTYENLAFSGRLRTNLFYKHYTQRVTLNEPYLDGDSHEYLTEITRRQLSEGGYGITLSFALLPDLYLLGSAERALRLPNENEMFGNVTENVSTATDLMPEESVNVNLGFNYKLRVGQHAFTLTASVYFRDTKNMIREMFSSGRETWSQYQNLEAVQAKGIDAELLYNWADRLNLRFNVSRFDVLFNTRYDSKGHPYAYYRTQIPNEPTFKLGGNISYHFKDLLQKDSRLTVHYNISYVEGFLRDWSNAGSSNLKAIPTQYPMDIGITYAFPKNKFVVGLNARNILDQQVYDNYGLQKPGRAFYAKLTYFIF